MSVPIELRAGACVEVWAPAELEYPPWIYAYNRHAHAMWAWLEQVGLYDLALAHFDQLPDAFRRIIRSPWSFDRLSPEERVEALRARGLPARWRPKPAPFGKYASEVRHGG